MVIEDSGDEFSENFNPSDTKAILDFESNLSAILGEYNWQAQFTLKKVEIEL